MAHFEYFLLDKLGSYPNVAAAVKDAKAALEQYHTLKPSAKTFVYPDGKSKKLVCLEGTIPVVYRGTTYNIPMCIWLQDRHPYVPPYAYVVPTAEMQIKAGEHVDNSGRIYLPFLTDWKPPQSDLYGLIQVLCHMFAEQPPVFARIRHPPPSTTNDPPAITQATAASTGEMARNPQSSSNEVFVQAQVEMPDTLKKPENDLNERKRKLENMTRQIEAEEGTMAAKPSSPVPNLQELVICSVCLEDFTDPRALPCLHSYCKACLERLITPEGKITCPECRIEVEVPDHDVSELSPNFVMNSLLDMLSLTNEVTTTHGDSADTPHCPSHEGRECELYCNDCSKLICFQCIVKWGDCHDHSYKDVTETADKFRENMQKFSEKRKLLLPTFEQHLSLLQGMKAQQVANTAEICEMIEESFRRHIESMNVRKNELVAAACAAQLQEEDGLLTEIDRVQLEKAKLEFSEKIMEIENPATFVQKFSEVREKFFEADIPELFSHVVRDVRFKENEAILRGVIVSYGEVVNKDAPSEEKPSGIMERVAAGNPRPLRQAESLTNIQGHQNDGGSSGTVGRFPLSHELSTKSVPAEGSYG